MRRVLVDDEEIHPPLAEDEALGDLPQRNDRLFGLWRIEKHLGRECFFFFVRYTREDGLLREKFLFGDRGLEGDFPPFSCRLSQRMPGGHRTPFFCCIGCARLSPARGILFFFRESDVRPHGARFFDLDRRQVKVALLCHLMPRVFDHFACDLIRRLLGRQRLKDAVIDKAEDALLIREFDLPLLRMHIHIDRLGSDSEGENKDRISILREQRMIGIVDGFRHRTALDDAAVDDDRLVLAAALQKRRLGNEPRKDASFVFPRNFEHFASRLRAVERGHDIEESAVPRRLDDGASVIDEAEGNIRIRECELPHHRIDAAGLGPFGFQEFLPSRHIIEEIAHLDRRAARRAGRLHFADCPALDFDDRALHVFLAPGRDGRAGDGGNARQRFSAKAQRGDVINVIHR